MSNQIEPDFFEATQQLLMRAKLKGHHTPLIENMRSGISDFSRFFSDPSLYLHAQHGNVPDFVFLCDGNNYERQLGVKALHTLGCIGSEAFLNGTSPSVDVTDLISAQRVFLPFEPLWAGMEHAQVFPFVIPVVGKTNKFSSAFNKSHDTGTWPPFRKSYDLADKHIIHVVKRHGTPDRIERYHDGIRKVASACTANIPRLEGTTVNLRTAMSLALHCDGICMVDKHGCNFPLFLREDIYDEIKEELNRFDIIWYKNLGDVWAYEPKDIPQFLISKRSSHLCYKSCRKDFYRYRDLYTNHLNMD